MLSRLFAWLRRRSRPPRAPLDLPTLERDDVSHLLTWPNGLPRVDWHMAEDWIGRQSSGDQRRADLRRAIMAVCLDELRDALPQDHRRWRSANVEGLAPLEGSIGPALAETAERSFVTLRRDLARIIGDSPIPPIAIVAIEPVESYIDFTDSYFPDEGDFATSGGMYLNDGDAFPLIAVSTSARFAAQAGVAHEMTHHALHGAGLPAWIEEGLTQMMEERIAGHSDFALSPELLERHRGHWREAGFNDFLDGSGRLSPEDDEQELVYQLSQWVVRALLQERAEDFFAFARACREDEPTAAFTRHLGAAPPAFLARLVGVED